MSPQRARSPSIVSATAIKTGVIDWGPEDFDEDLLHKELHLRFPFEAKLFTQREPGRYSFMGKTVELRIESCVMIIISPDGKESSLGQFLRSFWDKAETLKR